MILSDAAGRGMKLQSVDLALNLSRFEQQAVLCVEDKRERERAREIKRNSERENL